MESTFNQSQMQIILNSAQHDVTHKLFSAAWLPIARPVRAPSALVPAHLLIGEQINTRTDAPGFLEDLQKVLKPRESLSQEEKKWSGRIIQKAKKDNNVNEQVHMKIKVRCAVALVKCFNS